MRNMSRGVEGRAQLQGKHCKLKQLFNVEMKKKITPSDLSLLSRQKALKENVSFSFSPA